MKTTRLFAAVLGAAIIFSASGHADPGHDRHGRYDAPRHVKLSHHRHHGVNWVVPLVAGGVLGYALSEPRRESVAYVQTAYSPAVDTPLYEEHWAYFGDCDCQRKVLLRVR